ncbi:PARP-domain-containing protein [Lentinus tigrinus ALCF2SS1-6]|uniref:Poly [ADP-ribose] polymerase n=1 Tax=Lentinus tigrinus ALCF2SS1-6 TaxID=1328759 RepID=A0A5C2RYR9_9APHY|nr:PARP-domain-containing protein [Lentinus tigrinus ALCF2SS1-6]
MPPRKKPAAAAAAEDANDAPLAPTRSSGRTRAPSAKAAKMTKTPANGKRVREESDEENDDGEEEVAEEEDEEEAEEEVKKPAAKKARTAKGSAATTKAKPAKAKTAKAAANGKGKGKRTREDSDDGEEEDAEEDGEEVKRPTAKARAATTTKAKSAKGKGKKGTDADADADGDVDMDATDDNKKADDEEDDDKKPAGKKAASKKPAAKGKSKKAADGADDNEDNEDEDMDDGKKKKPSSKKPASKKPATKAKDVADLPAKMVTVIKRGAAPVDEHSGWVDSHQVLSTPEGVWDAMLNQTEIGKNANKYYKLQLLHPIGKTDQCTLYTRWGRVGENGSNQKKGPWPAGTAIQKFKDQFKAKTATAWEARVGMVQKKSKYVWIERSYDDEDDCEDDAKAASSSKKEEEKIPDSTLPSEIQILCRLIFNSSMIDAHLSSMNYDANKLPLGKLSKSTILSGFAALKVLSEIISQPNSDAAKAYGTYRQACEELTGRYYSIIPHVFGRERPIVIDSAERLKRELELVDALGDMEVASKLISSSVPRDASGKPMNPLDAHFSSLELTKMEPIAQASREFDALQAYARDTHGATHRHYGVQVLQAFRVEREHETKAWNKAGHGKSADGERLLLWHGSRTTNFAGILKQGLRIAPPEAPVTGYMFGKGVYFADMMSKSANYCHAYLSDNTGLLLLCEVVAKPFYEQHQANYNADQDCKKAGKKSTKGLGRTQPAEWQDCGDALDHPELRGCHMPKGPGKDVSDPKVYLQYNEYIVYDPSQIRLRYLLMVKMQ